MPEGLVCRHFGSCGGCSLQNLSDDTYAEVKRGQVVQALSRHGVKSDVRHPIRVATRSRRRAVFKAKGSRGVVEIGFHAASSHAIVDMRECLVLTPALVEASAEMRRMLEKILEDGETAELHATDTDTGLDVDIRWRRKLTPSLAAILSTWATKPAVARICSNGGVAVSLAMPMVRLANAEVELPQGAFLQPTKEGEEALQNVVQGALGGARCVADLFSGCGTFALALARGARVHAFDADAAMLSALAHAARRVTGMKPVIVERRDLFKRPLSARELLAFDGLVLDPPRAGAVAQVRELARAPAVQRIAYVSCNAETFARDARILCAGGYRLPAVSPVDQFLWSEHIELVGVFERGRK